MPAKRYHVLLTADERSRLQHLLNSGTAAARTLTHARILLTADEGPDGPHWGDAAIAVAVEISEPTVARVRARCLTGGVDAASPQCGPSGPSSALSRMRA